MAEPTDTDFVISQGDTLPVMHIRLPLNTDNELVDLSTATVTFLGRPKGIKTTPPPISVEVPDHGTEVVDGETVVWVDVKLPTGATSVIQVPQGSVYQEMEGELEIVDGEDKLTVPTLGYIRWFIRDDINEPV